MSPRTPSLQRFTMQLPTTPAAQPTPAARPDADKQPYQAPRVQDLGAWQAVTLISSVGFNQFGLGEPDGSSSQY